jgi:hypothetical protein
MPSTLRRQLVAVVALALVAGLSGSTALAAAPGHGRFGNRLTVRGGSGPFGGPGGGMFQAGPGPFGFGAFGVGRGFGIVVGGPGMMGPGGSAVLDADVLTPAASFLGISVATLQADLKGGKTLAQEATAKGKTADDLIGAIVDTQKKVYDGEVAAGWITDDQATALLARFKDGVTDLVNSGPPVPPSTRPQGVLQTAATFLGISPSDLLTDLKGGKSLAQIATDQGKKVDDLVTALVAPAKTRLDAAVAAGTITSAQEQKLIANLTTMVTNVVNNTAMPGATKITRLQALVRR